MNEHCDWIFTKNINKRSLNNVVLPKDQKRELKRDIEQFLKSEQWYKARGIPYKRGYLFEGKPGNGKTSTCLAIANEHQRDIYFLAVNDIASDRELNTLMRFVSKNSILVLEDIDFYFDPNKDKRKTKGKVSFSGLLNALDGLASPEGVITILTTNRPETLDKALIRKGRIDMEVEITNPQGEQIEEYLKRFYNQKVELPVYYRDNRQYSMADIQGICIEHKNNPRKAISAIAH